MATYEQSARGILKALGIGDFNATMIIQYMFVAPAQTDPQMAQIILLTRHLQAAMVKMGARAQITGSFDGSWTPYLVAVAGPDWIDQPWAEICKLVLEAQARRLSLAPVEPAPRTISMGGLGFLPDLPEIPGGLLTYGILGYFAWRHFKKRS